MHIEIDEKKCIGCSDCLHICPVGAIVMQNGKAMMINSICVFCGACANECTQQAIKIIK